MFLYGRQRGQQTSVESILCLFKGFFFSQGIMLGPPECFLGLEQWAYVSSQGFQSPTGSLSGVIPLLCHWEDITAFF